jgi:hypothetical protein
VANNKFIATRARTVNLYKNTRAKVLNGCANIHFNKQYLANKVTPKYANVKFPNTSPSSQITTKKGQVTRIKDDIKFLFKEKEKFNHELYKNHLKAAHERGGIRYTILNSINNTCQYDMQKKYNYRRHENEQNSLHPNY